MLKLARELIKLSSSKIAANFSTLTKANKLSSNYAVIGYAETFRKVVQKNVKCLPICKSAKTSVTLKNLIGYIFLKE